MERISFMIGRNFPLKKRKLAIKYKMHSVKQINRKGSTLVEKGLSMTKGLLRE